MESWDNTFRNKKETTKSYFEKPFSFFERNDKIELLSASKARIMSNDTTIYFDLIRKNGILYFQSLNQFSGLTDIEKADNRPYYLKGQYFIEYKTLLHQVLEKKEEAVAGIDGVKKFYTFKACLFAIETEDEILFPHIRLIEANWLLDKNSEKIIEGNKLLLSDKKIKTSKISSRIYLHDS